ncbi:hypothetical protein ES707_21346 [subsurface metagenome]
MGHGTCVNGVIIELQLAVNLVKSDDCIIKKHKYIVESDGIVNGVLRISHVFEGADNIGSITIIIIHSGYLHVTSSLGIQGIRVVKGRGKTSCNSCLSVKQKRLIVGVNETL